jgi:hypothetical protein
MKHPFYNEWLKKRLDKTINILGKDWFRGKSILELGACHGDFGISFIEMGSFVTFCDARIEHLLTIEQNLPIKSPIIQLDQNFPYDLGKKYDMVVHFGLLYHIENWKQDLKCALNHTNLMLLESAVCPDNSIEDSFCEGSDYCYDEYNCKCPIFTEKSVEKTLSDLGAKFIRFDNIELNTYGWISDNVVLQNVYNWNSDNYKMYENVLNLPKEIEHRIHYRRFWLVIK